MVRQNYALACARTCGEQARYLLINILDGLVMHAVHVEDREE